MQRPVYRLGLTLATGVLFSMAGLMPASAKAELKLTTTALENSALDELRGGFFLEGLEISIGLEQIVAVNGETQVMNRFFIPNLNQLSPDVSQLVSHQIGNDLQVATKLTQGEGILTQIQNSLDHAVIQNIRSLNIELSNVGELNAIPPLLDSHFLQSPGR